MSENWTKKTNKTKSFFKYLLFFVLVYILFRLLDSIIRVLIDKIENIGLLSFIIFFIMWWGILFFFLFTAGARILQKTFQLNCNKKIWLNIFIVATTISLLLNIWATRAVMTDIKIWIKIIYTLSISWLWLISYFFLRDNL